MLSYSIGITPAITSHHKYGSFDENNKKITENIGNVITAQQQQQAAEQELKRNDIP